MVVLFAVLCGLALLLAAGLSYRLDQDNALADLLGMAPSTPEVDDGGEDELTGVTGRAVDLAGQVVEKVDRDRSLGNLLERARIPLRPGEFVIVVGCASIGIAALVLLTTGSRLAGVGGAGVGVLLASQLLQRRVKRRRKAFEAQLPDALSLVASSLSAGHTFLRAVQMMCEESGPPLSEEFTRLVAETRLGDPLVDALDRMAARLQIRGVDIVVQAIHIQQSVGGRLADLLHTLADTLRARDEVKREILVLTAEGRLSAYVLAGMVPFLFIVIQVLNPAYIKPLYSGIGLVLLGGCALSVVAGLLVILRMVKIDV
ncbi:MAG: type II secretion system F family protein [Actinomycetota bacterium]|nr:type II secretion system F family protein [Actinomycetota bacterium]